MRHYSIAFASWSSRPMRAFIFAILCFMSMAGLPRLAVSAEPQAWIDSNLEVLVELYRHLHRHPELSFQEEKTAQRMAEEWRDAGFEVTTDVGGHGLVGLLKNGEGPTLMLRTDLDGLPVTEKTGLVYASEATVRGEDGSLTGVMHACGHDIHMTCVTGAAKFLAGQHRDQWKGTLMLVGQPAEERGAGAQSMLADGLFTRFVRPDYAVALHCAPSVPAGGIAYRAGFALANVDSVDIRLFGRGGHGAYPHLSIDPILEAARLVMDLQSIVSREVDPTQSAVITVGSIHGGTKHNVIPDYCDLQLTVRSYTEQVRQLLKTAIERKARSAAEASGAPEPRVEFSEGTPALFNDTALMERVVPVLKNALGESVVFEAPASMGGEDFSQYGRAGVPICMLWLGTVEAERLAGYARLQQPPPPLHSALFYPDAEPTIASGVTSLSSIALDLLSPEETNP